jgi:cyclopropane fatty-acyl-phospholipid synthase-like methyltransferase
MDCEADVDRQPDIGVSRAENKSDRVREVFENAPHYLKSRRIDIRFRVETVKQLAAGLKWQRLLDIGCGDGSISLQLLAPASHLTLLDLSASMVSIVKKNIPENLTGNVDVRNENFMTASFAPKLFDLIVTVGVMAHVDSPDAFLAKVKSLLRPGGSLIVEFTDSRHYVGQLGRFWGRIKELVAPSRYPTNRLSFADVSSLFEKHQLKLVSAFRYSRIPLPGIDRIVSHEMQYRTAKLMFGEYTNNRNAWLGNEYICLLSVPADIVCQTMK